MSKNKTTIINAVNAFSRGSLIGILISLIFNIIYKTDSIIIFSNEFMTEYGASNSLLILIIFSGLISLFASASSSIFQNKNRSLLQNTIMHYLLLQIIFICFALIIGLKSIILSFVIISTVIYIGIWIISYLLIKKEMKELNLHLKNK